MRWALALVNLAVAVGALWWAPQAKGPGATKYFGVVSLFGILAAYALLAKGRRQIRAMMLAPSAMTWFMLFGFAIMCTFLGPMDDAPYHADWQFLWFAAGFFALLAATLVEVVAGLRPAPR
jgi:hypothetical protein